MINEELTFSNIFYNKISFTDWFSGHYTPSTKFCLISSEEPYKVFLIFESEKPKGRPKFKKKKYQQNYLDNLNFFHFLKGSVCTMFGAMAGF